MSSIPSIYDLSPEEKLQLVEDLWDDLAATDQLPVREWQKKELSRRKQNLESHSAPLASWDEIRGRLRSRRG